MAASNFWNLFRFNNQVKTLFSQPSHHCTHTLRVFLLVCWVRGRRQAHNPTLTKIMRLTYNRSCSHNRTQTAACNAVYSISRRALLITRLGEQLPRPSLISPPNGADDLRIEYTALHAMSAFERFLSLGALFCQAGLIRASNLPSVLARKSESGAVSCLF